MGMVAQTTDQTLTADLQQSLLIEELAKTLIAGGIPVTEARYRAHVPVALYDAHGYDALAWMIAETLWRADYGATTERGERDLIAQPIHTRGRYVYRALQALGEVRTYSEGLNSRNRLERALAHYLSHRCQVEEARVRGPKAVER